jgi:hypothetical protein
MRCQKVRFFLSAYCKDELTGRKRDAIRAHLHVCPDCRREEILCRKIEGSICKVSSPRVSEDFNTALLNRVARERYSETRGKAYLPKNVPLFGWNKLVPVAVTACLVIAFALSGGMNILTGGQEQPQYASTEPQNRGLNDDYLTAQPLDNPAFQNQPRQNNMVYDDNSGHQSSTLAQHASSSWAFKRELERAHRIRQLMYELAGPNDFAMGQMNMAAIFSDQSGRSIVVRLPIIWQPVNNPGTVNSAGR